MTQDELAQRLAESGLPWRLAGQLERGETQLRSAAMSALCKALGMPERWFTASTEDLIAEPPVDPGAADRRRLVDELDRKLDEIIALLRNGNG